MDTAGCQQLVREEDAPAFFFISIVQLNMFNFVSQLEMLRCYMWCSQHCTLRELGAFSSSSHGLVDVRVRLYVHVLTCCCRVASSSL